MRSSAGSLGSAIASRQSNGGGKSAGRTVTTALLHELRQFRKDLVQVADDAEVGELEDRRVAVLVDRDDGSGALHADLVLDRAGDADRDVELRRHRLPGLADLCRVRVPARVDDRARGGDGTAERLGELLDELEVLGAAEPATAGDDHVGVLDRRAFALGVRLLDHRRLRREVLELDLHVLDLRLAAGLLRVESARAEEGDARRDFQPTSTMTES